MHPGPESRVSERRKKYHSPQPRTKEIHPDPETSNKDTQLALVSEPVKEMCADAETGVK